MKQRTTVHDVAAHSSVSIATVSRVLNTPETVRPATVQRVRAAMRELGYTPPGPARDPGRMTGRVGALLLTPGDARQADAFFIEILRGLESAIERAGLAIVVAMRSIEEAASRPYRVTAAGGLDGLIVVGGPLPGGYREEIRRANIPVVRLEPRPIHPGEWQVVIDCRRGIEEAVDHLLAHGRRRVVHVGGPLDSGTAGWKREGYLLAHARSGTAVDPALHVVEPALHSREGGRRSITGLLDAGVAFDAVVADDDLLAIGAIGALTAHGRRVPDDVAVVGYGDLDEARFVQPGLTTVHVDLPMQGWLAGTLLVQAVHGGTPPSTQIKLATHLVVRESCGASRT